MIRTILLLTWLLSACVACGQDSAVGFVSLPDQTSGSCVYLKKYDDEHAICVTALHVFQDSVGGTFSKGTATFVYEVDGVETKEVRELRCVGTIPACDLAILEMTPLKGVEPVVTSTEPAGDMRVIGYPWGSKGTAVGRYLRSINEVRPTGFDRFLVVDAGVNPGFSGGGVFDSQGALVAIVSGGWSRDFDRRCIWPVKAGRSDAILAMLKTYEAGLQAAEKSK